MKRSNPDIAKPKSNWIASSQMLLAMTTIIPIGQRICVTAIVALASGAVFAADLAVPPIGRVQPGTPPQTAPATAPPAKASQIPVQQNQPNCSRWTDECVTCTRGTPGSATACSNIGFACQPKSIRCLSVEVPQSEPRK